MKYRVKLTAFYLTVLIAASILFVIPLATSFIYRKLWFILFSVFLFLIAELLMISTLFGYVRLDETALYIRFGFFARKKIAYSRIRHIEKKQGLFRESLFSLNTAKEYIRIDYGESKFLTVSIRQPDDFIEKLKNKMES